MPRLWAAPATAPVPSPCWYWVFTAAWIWSHEYGGIATSPPAAVCDRAGAAAASTMASIAANNITFLNSFTSLPEEYLRAAFFHLRPPMSTPFTVFFTIFLKFLNNMGRVWRGSRRLLIRSLWGLSVGRSGRGGLS